MIALEVILWCFGLFITTFDALMHEDYDQSPRHVNDATPDESR